MNIHADAEYTGVPGLACGDVQGRTPLHCAAVAGRTAVAQELLLRGYVGTPLLPPEHHRALSWQ